MTLKECTDASRTTITAKDDIIISSLPYNITVYQSMLNTFCHNGHHSPLLSDVHKFSKTNNVDKPLVCVFLVLSFVGFSFRAL